MTDKERAEAYRVAAEYLSKPWAHYDQLVMRNLREEADRLDPPYKLDRSLRGWVMVTEPCSRSTWVWKAYESGLADRADTMTWTGIMTWGEVEKRGWRVEKLNVLQSDEVAVPRELFRGWHGLCQGVDWNNGTHAKAYRAIIEKLTREKAERMEAEG